MMLRMQGAGEGGGEERREDELEANKLHSV